MFDLQRFIKINGLTQNEIADLLGVKQPVISQAINGKMAVPNSWIERLMSMGYNVNDFIIIAEEPAPVYNQERPDHFYIKMVASLIEANNNLSKSILNITNTMSDK
jgi:transcriptional regulator with XRE-family HTH domain